MYSTFAVDKAIEFFFLQCHETSECPKKWHMLVVFFLSTLQLAKLAFEKPINSKLSLLGYHKLMSNVPLKYLFTTLKWDSLGQD